MKKTLLILAFALVQQTTLAQQAPALQWQKCLGGTANDSAQSIQPTPDGGYIMAGYTYSNDGDITGNHGGGDAWVAKISSTGSLQWQKALGGTSYDEAKSIQPTPDGGYIVTGKTISNDGDVTGNHGNWDAWVVKLSSTGSLQWKKDLGGTADDFAYSIQPTPDGGYILTGDTLSTNGDVTGNHGQYDAWVVKLSSTGNLQWQKCLGGTTTDYAQSIQPTPDGGYIMAGITNSNDGDVTGNHGSYDAWVVKLSSTGSLQWQKALGGTGDDGAGSIQPTADGGFIVSGSTQSTNGDVTGNHGSQDAWVVKLSSTGSLQWQKALGGTSYDSASSIQSTPDGGYIVSGITNSTNGDVTGNHGSYDCWVVKLSSTGSLQWQKALGGTGDDYDYDIQITPDGGYIMAGYTQSNDNDVTGNHGSQDAWVVKLGPELSTTGFVKEALVVYPNPASTLLTVQNNNNTVIDSITITDLMGKVVLTQTTNTNQVNVAPLASGTYFLEATSGKDQFTTKFVKE
jgi:uncharacterized delta-60 repeat protein